MQWGEPVILVEESQDSHAAEETNDADMTALTMTGQTTQADSGEPLEAETRPTQA